MVADHLALRVDPDAEQFRAEASGDTDDVELVLEEDDLEAVTFAHANSLFSLEYLKKMRKAIPKGTMLDLDLGEDFPVMIRFELAEGALDMQYMLAPRIKSD